jgi:spore maturation protein CgeB
LRIVYSFNKTGEEAGHWEREIRAASDSGTTWIPYNHGTRLDPRLYWDAVRLDRLYQNRDRRLLRLYDDLRGFSTAERADALFVTNCPPYHPEFLRELKLYKALYSTDDPGATYARTIPYLHAYDHVFYCSPTYSASLSMEENLRYCGVRRADWLPLGVFDFEFDSARLGADLANPKRDIDVVYVGGCFRQKLELLAGVRRRFGSRFRVRGIFSPQCNLYLNLRYGYGVWIRPVTMSERVSLYQRARIGINIHWSEHGLGNQRLYHLPANGAMQISDCPAALGRIFEVGREVVGYTSLEDLLEKISYYLDHDEERHRIAIAGHQRVLRDYRFATVTRQAAEKLTDGIKKSA